MEHPQGKGRRGARGADSLSQGALQRKPRDHHRAGAVRDSRPEVRVISSPPAHPLRSPGGAPPLSESLDELQELVTECFSSVPNFDRELPVFKEDAYRPEDCCKLFKVVPIKVCCNREKTALLGKDGGRNGGEKEAFVGSTSHPLHFRTITSPPHVAPQSQKDARKLTIAFAVPDMSKNIRVQVHTLGHHARLPQRPPAFLTSIASLLPLPLSFSPIPFKAGTLCQPPHWPREPRLAAVVPQGTRLGRGLVGRILRGVLRRIRLFQCECVVRLAALPSASRTPAVSANPDPCPPLVHR